MHMIIDFMEIFLYNIYICSKFSSERKYAYEIRLF